MAKKDLVKFEYAGVELEVAPGAFTKLRVLDALERGQIMTGLRLILGDEAVERIMDAVPDADADDAGKILELVAEKAGVKNS